MMLHQFVSVSDMDFGSLLPDMSEDVRSHSTGRLFRFFATGEELIAHPTY